MRDDQSRQSQDALGMVVAERTLRSDVKPQKLCVRIGVPQLVGRHEWRCPYQIRGLGKSAVLSATGLDAVQALILAVEAIRVRLSETSYPYSWEGGETGDTGFPRTVPLFFGSVFAATIDRLIDREVERHSKKLKKPRHPL